MGTVIGLVGGVASGKSTVARMLVARGLLVLDADDVARDVVGDPAVLGALVDRFGAGILDGQGRLDRPELARLAFSSPQATQDLNAVVHPEVRRRLLGTLEAAGERPVALDVPLLVESPLADKVTCWVFVQASETARDRRAEQRDWKPGERARREALQAAIADKRARADHILENDGTIEDLEARVDALLTQIGISPPSP